MSLIRYIHRNPIKAKLVTNLDDYFWSSYPVYIGKREPFNFLDFSLVAKQMRHDISFHKEFKQYHGIDVDDSIFDHESIIGDNDFIKDILDEAIVKDGYQKCNQVIIDELMINVISEYIAKLPEKENKRVRPCLVSKLTSLSNNEIASKFGLPSGDAVRQLCYRFKKALQDSENYQLMYKELLEAKQKLLGID